ncbi:MAG: hypothetical protein ABIQ95_01465 [Bdellovibrionia bacterium]
MSSKRFKFILLLSALWMIQIPQIATAQLANSYVNAPGGSPRVVAPTLRPNSITVGLQFPTGLVFEFRHSPSPRFSFAVDTGGYFMNDVLLDSGAHQGGVKNSLIITALEGRAQLHPSEGPFYVGAALGWQRLWVSGLNGDPGASGSLSGIYTTPHVGWMWALENGFTYGVELGVQIPIGNRSVGTASLNAVETANAIQGLSAVAGMLVPYFNFIKLGYSY